MQAIKNKYQEIIVTDKKTILLIGWDPDSVDYNKWPGLNPEKLRSALEAERSAPKTRICFNTNPSDTADAVKRWL
jgi:hypothetical protein